jgi:ribonuclease BN (tRNA processing enzyme)
VGKPDKETLELLFLGTGNAFAAEGSAFNSFVLNGRYLFDSGPTVLQQIRRAKMNPDDLEVILISHFHGDHFFGLPFLFLEFWRRDRRKELTIAGPPGIEERAEMLFETGFPGMPVRPNGYRRRYIEVQDGLECEAAGLEFTAAKVEHVASLECFAYRGHAGGRTMMYSGDSKLCDGLLRLAPGAEVLVMDCSNGGDPVHMSQKDVAVVRQKASENATTIVTHLDGFPPALELDGVLVAHDLARFRL